MLKIHIVFCNLLQMRQIFVFIVTMEPITTKGDGSMTNDEVFEKIHEEFILRGMSLATEDSYRRAFRIFLRHCENRNVETLGEEDIREFLFHQISIGKSSGTVNIYNSALRFVFGGVLGQNLNCRRIPRRSHRRELPAILSKTEIVRFFSAIDNLRDKAIFETVYGAGLRVSEVVRLRVQDIDSNGMRLFVHHGKVAEIVLHCYPKETLICSVITGSNTDPITLTDICSTRGLKEAVP